MNVHPRSLLRTSVLSSHALAVLALGAVACSLVNGSPQADGGAPPLVDGSVAPGMDPRSGDDAASGDGGSTEASSRDAPPPTDAPPGNDAGGPVNRCSTGTVIAGNPVYAGQPTDRPAAGTGILADPPLPWTTLVFDGPRLYTQDDANAVWVTDLSAASPVETIVAGAADSSGQTPFNDGPCASARFGRLHGIALLPDGSLVVSDYASNAVLHVTHPTAANCAVEYWAGTSAPIADENIQTPPSGDQVGPGAQALFNGPSALATDAAGNAYVFDSANRKLKKIGNDAQHTVTTLAALPSDGPDALNNLTRIGSTLYAVGASPSEAFVLGFDTTTGAMTTVKRGGGAAFPPVDSAHVPVLHGIATDGQGLLVAGSGYLWHVSLAGDVQLLAGTGVTADFPPTGYDPKAPQPAMSLVLEENQGDGTSGALDFLAYQSGAVYFRGHGEGTAFFVEKIACP